jgi:hypothetical protein
LPQQDASCRDKNVQALAEFANDGLRFGQVFAQRPFALDKKGNRIQSEAVDAETAGLS